MNDETHTPSDTDQQIAALMMARSGLTVADIAKHLRVHPEQVRAWLDTKGEDDDRRNQRR